METKILKSFNSLRVIFAIALTVGITLPSFGDSKTFYYSAGAKSTDTAKGKVYVGKSSATGSSTYENEMTTYTSKEESAIGGSAPTKTSGISFYYSAKANDGYVFLGWKATNSESAAYDYESVNFTWNREVSNTTAINSNPSFDNAKVKYYAFFGSGIINLSHELIAFDKTQTGSFTVSYTANGTINIESTNSDFSVSPASISATGSGSQTITVSYNGSAEGTANTKINVTCTGLEPKSLDAVAVPGTITSANASSVVIETGTVSTSTEYPYHPMENIDLTPCFAGTTASFDALYLFGKTLNKTDFTATSLNINTATTPCYVYHKSGNSYVFTKVVEMNSDIKGIGVSVAANNSKLFFSGWCPYASCGYKSEDIGVFHITGGNNARVDVYLNNPCIYARTKFNGHLISDYYAETSSSSYPTGSGGVFVFQTSASTSSTSFKAYVHVNGDNLLSSQQGNQIKVSLLGNVRYAAQCSSPIHMYTTNWSSQYEELTIDDVWPSSGGDARTNGALQLMKSTNQAPSIDLGNQRSIVNFNGGRITLQNAIPVSDKYQTAFSISCRSYSQSGVTVYGLGNDQAEGTVNFNDGTIDVLPLSESDYTKYSSYYRDNKSIKCPSNVFINGGSYNCSIWKCDEAADLGASPTDKSGTAVCKLSIAQTGTETNGMAQYAIPSVFKSGLDAYYAEKGWTYGQQSIAADDEGNVNLMLPCDLIDESAIVNTEVIPWVGILPDFSAGAMGHYIDFGGNQTILSDETHSTERFLYGRMDDNVYNELPNYATPTEAASVTLKSNDYNKNALNAEPFTIASNSYILLPIVADHWFFFSAPFDVKKVSLIDAYPDALAAEQTVAQALQKQAESNMDLFYYIGQGLQAGSQLDIEGLISQWVNCEKTIRYPDESSTIKNQFKKRELLPYPSIETAPSKSYFWLYENENEWTYDGKNFSGQTLITEKSEDTWMQKGKVYSMMFPSEGIATGDWKYWTGKYILIEGGENCEIEGTNSQPSTSEIYSSTNKASIKGNHTFADIATPTNLGAFWGYDYGTGTYKHEKSKTNPTQAFLYTAATPNDGTPAALNAIAANGRCYYTISYKSSNITVIAAPEAATYSLENNAGIKYLYSNSVWKQLTYDNEKNLYLGDDAHYYRYNESILQWELAEYTITWKDDSNETIEMDENVPYGATPSYDGDTPTKTTTAQYTFSFAGWTPEVVAVTGDATYKATFDATAREYTITWHDADGSALTPLTTNVQFGVSPTHDAPSPAGDCWFTGWKASDGTVYDGELPTVGTNEVFDETYTAQYACTQKDIVVGPDQDEVISNNTTTTTTTVHVRGTLNVSGVTLTTDDLVLEGTPTSSGEITGDGTVNATQHAYYHLTKDGGFKAKTWYAVAVPWQVDVPAYDKAKNGVWVKVKEKDGSGEFVQQKLGLTYDLIYYDGARRASQGHDDKCWKYVEFDAKENHIMFPGRAYMIYFLKNIDEIRFVRKDGATLKTTKLAVAAHSSSDNKNAGWNGIANPSTYHAFINPNTLDENTYGGVNYGQVYKGDNWTYEPINLDEEPLVVGQPVYVQVKDSMDEVTAYANHDGAFHAPRRATANAKPLIQCEVGIAPSEGETTDRVIVRALEDKEDEYVIAQDLMKLGVSTVAPQMWVDRYDSRLCINTIAPTGKKAEYPLHITIPYDGSYTIGLLEDLDANTSLYLTYNGRAIWNLGYGAYEAYLPQGTNTQYGLRIIYDAPQVTTGMDEATIENGEQVRKVMIDDKVYIIRNGEMYSITGAKVQ